MATKDERLKALEQKQAQIKAQIQALKARDTAQEQRRHAPKGADRRLRAGSDEKEWSRRAVSDLWFREIH